MNHPLNYLENSKEVKLNQPGSLFVEKKRHLSAGGKNSFVNGKKETICLLSYL